MTSVSEPALSMDADGFRALAAALPQLVWVSGATGKIDFVCPKWATVTGRSVAELLEQGFDDLVHPEDRAALEPRRDPNDPNDDALMPIEFRLRRHDGEYRLMETRMRYVLGADGQIDRLVGGALDVTDQRAAAKLATERSEQLRAALDVTGLGRFATDPTADTVVGDARLSEIVGMSAETLAAGQALEHFMDSVHPDDAAGVVAGVQAAIANGADYDAQYRIHRPTPDGGTELRWIAARARVVLDRSASVRMVGVVEDITDRRREEEARLQSQKREAIGTLASGIAHDFNNVISAILSNAVLGQAELASGASPKTSLVEIARGARRAGDLVQHLLAVSREEEPGRVTFDLGDVVEEACALFAPTLSPNAEFSHVVDRPLPLVTGDPTQLHAVVMNLIANAAHAAGSNGTIAVSVDRVVVQAAGGGGPADGLAPGHYLAVSIRDDGPGMTGGLLERAFDPFFTTKPAGEGTGLGLTAAMRIARNHAGDLKIESEVGTGTTATVWIPADAAQSQAPVTPAPQAGSGSTDRATTASAANGTRVYFVDDEPALVRLADRALPMRGFETTSFEDAREALAMIAEDPYAVDVLVTDLSMPGLTGLELIAQVRALRPNLPVVLSSGLLTGEHRRQASALTVDRIVPKPCSLDELANAIMSVVRARA